MTKTPEIEFAEMIASNMDGYKKPLTDILDVLEDGEALSKLGTDADLEIVESTHELLSRWVKSGIRYL